MSVVLDLNTLKQVLSLSLELGWWPASPSNPLVSASHSAGDAGTVQPHPTFSGLRFPAQGLMLGFTH